MTTDKETPFEFIRRMAGWTPAQASAAMPTHGKNTYAGVMIRPQTDDRTWAQREFERDHQGWERVP